MMTLGQIARVVGGRLTGADPSVEIRGVSTDTRALRAGELYFALKGPIHDGHKFIEEALRRGAPAAVSQHEIPGGIPLIVVGDTVKALGDLAAAYRLATGVKVVAITGTNGKTTTKEMTGYLLEGSHATVRAPMSFNNAVGVPLTLLSADERTEFVVVEVGTSGRGEIRRLGEICRPDVAVITNVSEGHLAGLGSAEGVAREKESLLDWIRSGGMAVLNADNRYTAAIARSNGRRLVTFGMYAEATFRAKAVRTRGGWLRFVVDGVPFKVRSTNRCNVYNALAAIAVARVVDEPMEACAQRLIEYAPPPMRMERQHVDGVTFVNDAYNANPVSTRAALASFGRMRTEGRRVLVLGDMRELGTEAPRLHQEVARFAAGMGFDLVLTVGDEMGRAAQFFDGKTEWASFRDAREAAPFLRAVARSGDTIMLKASRSIGLEAIVEHFRHA